MRGYSLIETMIAIGLTAGVVLVASEYYSRTISDELIMHNLGAKNLLSSNLDRFYSKSFAVVSVLRFHPSETFVPTTATSSGYEPAGASWSSNGENIAITDIAPIALGSATYTQDSHKLESYLVEQNTSTNIISKRSLNILISRCIDREQPILPRTYAEIDALPRPFWINNKIHCCKLGEACPNIVDTTAPIPKNSLNSDNHFRLWPTIFIYRSDSDGDSWTMPAERERLIVPSTGFFIFFEKRVDPTSATLVRFSLVNKCKLTRIKFGNRSPNKCAVTSIGSSNYDNFETDLEMSIIADTKKLTGGVASSAAIDVGTGDIFKRP